ncbi:LRR receptor-like serine/threonine-protein kinase EFR [Linum perenne]
MISVDPLRALTSWNDSTHFCEWYGVSCSKRHYGRVTALDLSSQGLSGSISPHVGNLSFLKVLSLYNNSFTREIPHEIGRLWRLQNLVLYNNSLEGEIPSNISRCSSLIHFHVGNNKLEGRLPWQFSRLNKLQDFSVMMNNLIGNIPSAFGNLSSLQLFNGGSNRLTGKVPDALGRLKNIQYLVIESNNLYGEIPTSIFNLSSLTDIWFGENKFHGILPWNLGISLPNLHNFIVNDNQFTSSIPPSLSNASNLVLLQLATNNFTGSIPSMAGSNKLVDIVIVDNFLGTGEANDLSFLSSLSNATSLRILEIGKNNFGGSLTQHVANLPTSLKKLSINDNKISGEFPNEMQYLVNLEVISGYNNNLSGTIPSSIGKLKSLVLLELHNNKISGYIPLSMGNLTKLIRLGISNNYLHGEIPASIQNCRKLLQLNLYNNYLSGVIPRQVLSLTSLSIVLDLSYNEFTGVLPAEVGNLKSLGVLDLSYNRLSGNIPSSLGSCISLESLYLQDNHLEGIIPSSMSSLRGIQKLDLSDNNLSGQIPKFLELMNISQLLNLSHNNFDGEVPKQGVFKNGSIISLVGNSKLCGGIAALKLPPCNFTRQSKKTLSLTWKIVISTISSLLFLTFIGSCFFILLIRQRGRHDTVSMDDLKLLQSSYQRLFEATNGFSSANLIGVGNFGSVYKGVLGDHIDGISTNIAVKVFNLQRHGASKSFMAESSVVDYLHNHCGTPIVHCDLKPSNILLDEDMVAHVGDFGLARSLSTIANPSSSSIGIKGTIGYAPPEYGMGNEVSIQGDVYSYGVLLLELFTGRRPTNETFRDGLSLHNVVKSALSKQHILEVVDPILLNELLRILTTHHNHTIGSPEEARKDIEKLMSSILEIGVACSSDIPQERLGMSEVSSKLTTIKTSLIGRR